VVRPPQTGHAPRLEQAAFRGAPDRAPAVVATPGRKAWRKRFPVAEQRPGTVQISTQLGWRSLPSRPRRRPARGRPRVIVLSGQGAMSGARRSPSATPPKSIAPVCWRGNLLGNTGAICKFIAPPIDPGTAVWRLSAGFW